MVVLFSMNVVKENIEVRIYPAKADKNDKGEKIANIGDIEFNIGIYRFIYNKEWSLSITLKSNCSSMDMMLIN